MSDGREINLRQLVIKGHFCPSCRVNQRIGQSVGIYNRGVVWNRLGTSLFVHRRILCYLKKFRAKKRKKHINKHNLHHPCSPYEGYIYVPYKIGIVFPQHVVTVTTANDVICGL